MKILNKAACLLLTVAVAVSALDTNAQSQETENNIVNSEELDEMIDGILSKLRIDKRTVSVALKYTGSGEYYYYNADNWIYSASLYKMPVCMTYSHKIKTGELPANSLSGTDAYIYEKILCHSDYCWVAKLESVLYGNGNRIKQMRQQDLEYSGFDTSILPIDYFSMSMYSARFYLGIIEELYYNSDEYPEILDYMTGATPTKYFCRNLGDKYPVAQKYGSDAGSVHAAGVIFMDEPLLLVIMTSNKSDAAGNRIIGELSESLVKCAEEWGNQGE